MWREELIMFVRFLGRYHLNAKHGCNGLVVLEDETWVSPLEVWELISQEVALCKLHYDGANTAEKLGLQLKRTFSQSYWALLELFADPPLVLRDTLKLINTKHLLPEAGNNWPLPRECGLIALARRDLIESEFSQPNFYSLFGAILCL